MENDWVSDDWVSASHKIFHILVGLPSVSSIAYFSLSVLSVRRGAREVEKGSARVRQREILCVSVLSELLPYLM